ncbi:hypothetical protein F5148DRAFT_1373814 [Russula earlei]|uniref:Uncharacterized protein n=1 Tax=Russula earlei TaxID=71964 RepID=A0ACC0UJ44_9AGAM|nr:hypothetical protein F5148DRAFT_1373814 [Russula earlei]
MHTHPPQLPISWTQVQRARVLRSSRKVGAVLGTTPFLVESCGTTVRAKLSHASKLDDTPPFPMPTYIKHHHRHFSVCQKPQASSESLPIPSLSRVASSSKESLLTASDESTEELAVPWVFTARPQYPGGNTSRPIILFNPVPLSSSDARTDDAPLSPSPLSPNAELPPLTPTTPMEPSRAEARRRKMARVVRTLGERVPPELVFRSSDTDLPMKSPVPTVRPASRTRSAPKNHRPRSASVGSTTQWQRLLELPAPIFSSSSKAPEDQRWVGEWNRRNMAQVQRELRSLRFR